jgi:hypothetical protein
LGAFEYKDWNFESKLGNREERVTQMLENGARYMGEWLVST